MTHLPQNLYRIAQVRDMDRVITEQGLVSGFELMSRAGLAVFTAIQQRWAETQHLTVFCGTGNNAGDGYIIAKLALLCGWQVQVFSLTDAEQLTGDALIACRHFLKVGGKITPFTEQYDAHWHTDVIVDALLGSGLSRPVTGRIATAIAYINAQTVPIVAVDIPSGLCADTGQVLGCAVKAHCTVTFIALKQGLFTGFAPHYCGELVFADCAIPSSILQTYTPSARRVLPKYLPTRPRYAHKGMNGHVLVIGGSAGYLGAALLAGSSALYCGAGLVSIATCSHHASLLTVHRPELMAHGIESIEDIAPLIAKASVLAIGTGLGQSEWAKSLLTAALASDKPLVVDADALNLLAQAEPMRRDNWILTPHVGEAGRLLNCTHAEIQANRFEAVRQLQARYGGVGVLKGSGTLIASANSIMIANTGNAGMAVGGMGDVLTGVIAALIAQGGDLMQSAQQGVYGHGYAADCAVKEQGERGLLPSDLMPYLRQWVNLS